MKSLREKKSFDLQEFKYFCHKMSFYLSLKLNKVVLFCIYNKIQDTEYY